MRRRIIISGDRSYVTSKKAAQKLAGRLMKLADQNSSILEVIFLCDRAMRALKRKHVLSRPGSLSAKRKLGSVNVLSFPEPKGSVLSMPRTFLGEIYLNGDICIKSPKELPHLFIHGFLHLLGYRHDGRDSALHMERLEALAEECITSRSPRCCLEARQTLRYSDK